MRCSAGYKKITGVYIGCVLIFLLLFPVVGHIGVTYYTAAETKQEQYFRSALELLKLIDGAVTEDEDEIVEGGSHEK